MKPINSKERSKAYYKVIGFFLISLALAILLGFSTMNVTKLSDYATKKQLDDMNSQLDFQMNVFQPNISIATKKLNDLKDYKTKALDPNATKGEIETSLKEILSQIKADDDDPQYIMYRNVVETYFALESALDAQFKLEEKLETKEGVVQIGDVDLNRVKSERDDFYNRNRLLQDENKGLNESRTKLNNDLTSLQNRYASVQNQLAKCRDSLNKCLVENRGYRQQKK